MNDEHADVAGSSILVFNDDNCWLAIGDEVVVYDAATTDCHVLDRISALMWQCFDGAGSVDEILTDVAAAFGVDLDTIASDCKPVINQWVEGRFLVEVSQ